VLAKFVSYDYQDRPIDARSGDSSPAGCPSSGDVVSRSVLGGLRYIYERAACRRLDFLPPYTSLGGLSSKGVGTSPYDQILGLAELSGNWPNNR
jgi:hypothetical protein